MRTPLFSRGVPVWAVLAVVAALLGGGFAAWSESESAKTPDAVTFQPCAGCGALVFPTDSALRTVCAKCGRSAEVVNCFNPTDGTPEEQPNRR